MKTLSRTEVLCNAKPRSLLRRALICCIVPAYLSFVMSITDGMVLRVGSFVQQVVSADSRWDGSGGGRYWLHPSKFHWRTEVICWDGSVLADSRTRKTKRREMKV